VVAKELRAFGFDCPDVTAMFRVGEKDNRNHIRVVCGRLAAADLAQIRIIAGGSGIQRAQPWSDDEDGAGAPSLAQSFSLKASLD
jgi:hypothetical protein